MPQAKKKDDGANALGVPVKAEPVGPGDPVEHAQLSQMGATFAERRKAREAAEKKAVRSAENKSVKSADSK